jgi:hypothetical protein
MYPKLLIVPFIYFICASVHNSAFVWDAGGTEDTFDRHVGGLPGISVTFTVKATNNLFIHISDIRIIVHPYT